MAAAVKICHICATDVSQKKRTKDAQGHYYCEACYKMQHGPGAAAAVADLPARKRPAAIEEDDGLIELADDVRKSKEPDKPQPMFGCADCKKIVPEKQIRNDDGDFVCLACFAKRREKAPAAAKPKKALFAETEQGEDENREGWKDTLVGGGVISACVIVVTFAVYFLLYLYLPPLRKGEVAPGAGYAALVAGITTVFTVFQAAMLILSMIFAARLLGGIDFGYIGSAVWKSLVLVLGFGVLSFFSDRFEAIWMLSYGFKWTALIVAFVVVFKIDFFEAMILAIVNVVVFFAMAIALGAILLSLRHHGGDVDEDSAPMHQNEAVPAPNVDPGE